MAVAVLGSLGCDDAVAPPPAPDVRVQPPRTIELRVGQNRLVGAVDIRLVRVRDDSRCAVDVTCIWHGNAVADLRLSLGLRPAERVSLNSDVEPREVEWNGLRIALVELLPQAVSTSSIEPGAYRVKLRVAGVDAR